MNGALLSLHSEVVEPGHPADSLLGRDEQFRPVKTEAAGGECFTKIKAVLFKGSIEGK